VAHFYGILQGNRGEASRLGTTSSGMDATVASWQGAVSVRLWYDSATDTDMADVSLIPWHGAGDNVRLYAGPVSGAKLRAIGGDGPCGGCTAWLALCRCLRVEG
jgi:hypothetical protein